MAAVPPRHSQGSSSARKELDPRHARSQVVELLAGAVFQLLLESNSERVFRRAGLRR